MKRDIYKFLNNLQYTSQKVRQQLSELGFNLICLYLQESRKVNPQMMSNELLELFENFFDKSDIEKNVKYFKQSSEKIKIYKLRPKILIYFNQIVQTLNLYKLKQFFQLSQQKFTIQQYTKEEKVTIELNQKINQSIKFDPLISYNQIKTLSSFDHKVSENMNIFSDLQSYKQQKNNNNQQQNKYKIIGWRLQTRYRFFYRFSQRAQLSLYQPNILQIICPSIFNIGAIGQTKIALGASNGEIVIFSTTGKAKKLNIDNQSINQKQQEEIINKSLKKKFVLKAHKNSILSLSMSYDQFYLLSSAVDKHIRLWCLRTGICLCLYKGHLKTIWSVAFAPNGYYFVSGCADCQVRLWRTDLPYCIRIFTGHKRDVIQTDFLKNKQHIISASLDKTIKIWSIQNASCVISMNLAHCPLRFIISYTGRYMVVAQQNGDMSIWFMPKMIIKNMFNLSFLKTNQKYKYMINSMSMSVDQKGFFCITKKELIYYETETLLVKPSKDVYDNYFSIKSNQQHIRPKQVLDIGQQCHLIECKFLTSNVVLSLGKK